MMIIDYVIMYCLQNVKIVKKRIFWRGGGGNYFQTKYTPLDEMKQKWSARISGETKNRAQTRLEVVPQETRMCYPLDECAWKYNVSKSYSFHICELIPSHIIWWNVIKRNLYKNLGNPENPWIPITRQMRIFTGRILLASNCTKEN